MQTRLVNFIEVLRNHDIRVSPAETLEAMAAANALGYADRDRLRDGLAITLAKTRDEEARFVQCFERFFQQDLPGSGGPEAQAVDTAQAAEPDDDAAAANAGQAAAGASLLDSAAEADPLIHALLNSPLMRQLMDNNRNELAVAINRAADEVNLRQMQMFTQKGQFTRKILDALGEEHLRNAVVALEQRQDPALAELQRYRDLLREQVRDRVEREYLLHAQGRNQQFMEDILSRTRLNNLEHRYLHRVGELVRKMARRLAARHSHKRRVRKRGQLDMARTLRKGIPNDGLMFNTYWRQTRKDKPQLLAICDVSGSVAAYAKFLLLFLYSLQDVLPKVRSFAFSSHLGEVSELFTQHPVEQAIELVNWRYGGATDYGSSFEDLAELVLNDINSNTTVIILGDARNNNGDPRLDILRSIYQRSKRVIWLNPESRRAWGTGDSEMLRYQSACHFTSECNNLKQLERVVDQLLKLTR